MENSNESWKNDLISFPIWGRAMGVPVDLLTTNNTMRMAARAGEVITVNNSDISKMVADGFFRFRVWMSIKKLVCPGFSLPFAGKKLWIAFKYDELPYMCFKCGKIGHSIKDCNQDPVTMKGEENEVVNAYGIWLKSENSCRDGFQGHRLSMENQSSQGDHTHKKTMGVTHGTVISNSFGPLEDTIGGVDKMIADLEVQQESMENIKDGGTMPMIQAKDKISSDRAHEGINATWEDGGRGKRRMVDNLEFSGYEKAKKSNTSLPKDISDNDLFNVPISYSMEAHNLEGSTPFVVGSNSKEMSKENRRKVSVKKDSKAKKGKMEGKVAGVSQMGDLAATKNMEEAHPEVQGRLQQ
uniref:CCHC-type domain-containing protein n=1 Tax=Cannabis sativa TaxID=3483 RepID=A0A803PLN4_CANSA